MTFTMRRHLTVAPEPASQHASVETDEHEVIDFDACSEDELKAKLHDFYAWAS